MDASLLQKLYVLSDVYDVEFKTSETRPGAVIASRDYIILCEIGDRNLLVGYDGMNPKRSASNPMFWGHGLAAERGFSGLHIYPLQNCWYQRDTLRKLLRRIAESGFLDGFARRVAIGGSMGGCGALWNASALNCSDVLAFNPQTVLDAEIVAAGEDRFREGRQMDWQRERLPEVLASVNSITVVYDPVFYPDVRQVEVLRTYRPDASGICLPYAGHSTPIFLARTGKLSSLVEDFVRGTFDLKERREIENARKTVGRYYANMAAVARRNGKQALAQRLTDQISIRDLSEPLAPAPEYSAPNQL